MCSAFLELVGLLDLVILNIAGKVKVVWAPQVCSIILWQDGR